MFSQLYQMVRDTPPPSKAGLTCRKYFFRLAEVFETVFDHPLERLTQMGSEGDGPVAAELLPGFAVLVDGNDYGVFPPLSLIHI